ncbi:MAG TPA: cyclic nucleotide-binding domain-containing protein [Polyangiales bacterium]
MQDPAQGGGRGQRGQPATQAERPTVTEGEHKSTTVRCAFPEEAASTLHLGEAKHRAPPAMPAQRFEDQGEIARGGMSSVRKVFDRLVLREVAMKVLEPSRTFDELARFIEEAQITGQLDHPNIVPIHDVELDDKGLPTRFTMKLVRGQTLHAALDQYAHGELSAEQLEELLGVFLKVCDALAFAHSRGVIHRDLKPANIMIGSHGQVYVMDWGIAMLRQGARPSQHGPDTPAMRTAAETLQEAAGSLSGTPAYMAPEQAQGRIADIDERTDVYGLGGILYQVLTLRPPHDGANASDDLRLARAGLVPPPTEVVSDRTLPPFLCRIVMKALAAKPSERYACVEDLKRDVETFLRGGGWFTQKRFAPGTLIVREGDVADAAYIITAGQCELSKTADGQKRFVRLLGAGEVFGETAIFGSTTRTATVMAHGEVTVLVVTRQALERELDRSQWLRSFVEALAERFVETDRKLTRLTSERPPDSSG